VAISAPPIYVPDAPIVQRKPQLQIIHKDAWIPGNLSGQLQYKPRGSQLGKLAADIILRTKELTPEMRLLLYDRIKSAVVVESDLWLTVIRAEGKIERWGEVSRKVVTDNGVALIVDALDNTTANADVRYHGLGTGTNSEAAADSALQTELTTQYNPDSTRATGTFSQPAANQSRSVATNTVDATAAVTEHGVFTQAATGGGTLLDRSQFSVVNLASGDSLQSTYTLTFTSGG